MDPPSRRRLLRLCGLGALGSLAGCGGLVGGESNDGRRGIGRLPAGADLAVGVDVDSLLADGRFRRGVDDGLSRIDAADGPASVAAALGRFESRTGLDPGGLSSVLAFAAVGVGDGPTALDVREDYAGAAFEADWSTGDVADALREREDVEERTYAGRPVYATGGYWLAALDDGRFVGGRREAVRDALDVAAGDGEAAGGDLAEAYATGDDGYVRFGFDVPQDALAGADLDPPLDVAADVRYVSGTAVAEGGTRTVSVAIEAESTDVAGDLEAIVRAVLAQAVASQRHRESDERYAHVLEGVEVTQDRTTVRVTRDLEAAAFGDAVAVATAFVGPRLRRLSGRFRSDSFE